MLLKKTELRDKKRVFVRFSMILRNTHTASNPMNF